MSHPHDDQPASNPTASHFQDVLHDGLRSPERRDLIRGVFCAGTLASVFPWASEAHASEALGSASTSARLGFTAVDKSLEDNVILPPGYRYQVVHATGDAINFQVPGFTSLGLESDDFTNRIGDQHDGLDLFFLTEDGKYSTKDTGRALLVVNHESSAESAFLHVSGQTSNGVKGLKFDQFREWNGGSRPLEEVVKEINIHGVSITEIRREGNVWRMVRGSPFNRRITPETEATVTGPVGELANIRRFFVTQKFPKGDKSRGTINNCGSGRTPWGTYLTCEENFYTYFSRSEGARPDARMTTAFKRYGIPLDLPTAAKNNSQGWHTVRGTSDDSRFARWDVALKGASAQEDFRNEPNTFGYVTEIDPVATSSAPTKRVAMGRFVHEAAVFGEAIPGKPLVVYMGCDGRNEYIYKFVTKAVWDPKDVGSGIAAGNKYLTEGRLYAARFHADGSGEWLPIDISNPAIKGYEKFAFQNQADVLVHARIAADAAGATPMDRPEWGAMNPANGEIYFSLTNNNAASRTPGKTNPANPRAYLDTDGKKLSGNPNGHIIRFKEADAASPKGRFRWDVFLFGAEEDLGAMNLSKLSAKNSFSSPDGLWFSKATGICWIETDDGAMTDESNCMLLAAIPGRVGDGSKIVIKNELNGQSAEQETFMGAVLGDYNLRRFLTAPKGSEVTGICETPDGRALFINIQHPGEDTKAADLLNEKTQSAWPGNVGYGKPGRPRSATIVITRDDGGVIGT